MPSPPVPDTTPPPPAAPREPEIELLGRLARGFLHTLRAAFAAAGVAAVVVTVLRTLDVEPPPDLIVMPGTTYEPPPWTDRLARHLVWSCAGLPLLLPHAFVFGRGRWLVLAALALLTAAPALAAGDHTYGFVLRLVACFCGVMTLLVLRVLVGLAPPTLPSR